MIGRLAEARRALEQALVLDRGLGSSCHAAAWVQAHAETVLAAAESADALTGPAGPRVGMEVYESLLVERDRLAAQVAALREALKSIARHVRRGMAPAGHMSLEEIAVRDANVVIYDTQAAAEAHDVAVEKRGYELGRHDSKVDERSYRAGLERAAQIAESADNLHQWPGSEAQQIAAAIRSLSAPAQGET